MPFVRRSKSRVNFRGSPVSDAGIKVARVIFSMIDGYVSESVLCLGYMMVCFVIEV